MTPLTPPPSRRHVIRYLPLSLLALILVSPSFAQEANKNSTAESVQAEKEAAKRNAAIDATASKEKAAAKSKEETVVLSPFVVTTNKNAGYFAANTLAGSRLNTDVADLASSITVITKQQMSDTSSTNINDVFMYEASTEGANTYTQTDVSRNSIPRDTIAGYSADTGAPSGVNTANRLRGLSAPDAAQNNYPAISRVAFDPYNTNSLEISRGPNSLIFGTGSPAGIVNQSTAPAVLNQQSTNVEARVGSWDDIRGSFSHNQPLIEDKLALYVAAVDSSVGYRRKPSHDLTKRAYLAFTYQPTPKTLISGNLEYFDNFNNRPNSETPRDYVTPWLQAGRPAYDPVTRTVTILDTGVVKGPYVTDTRSPGFVSTTATPLGTPALQSTTSAQYVPGIQFGPAASTRPILFTDRGVPLYVISPIGVFSSAFIDPYLAYNAPAAAARTPAQWAFADRRLTSSTGPLAPAGIGSYVQPSSTNLGIYDYEHINILQMNYQRQHMKTYNLEFQQELLSNLHFAAGWFRQELASIDNFTVSNANAITTLYVDTNKNNMDGTPNTHFGNPYLLDISPDTFLTPETNDNLRAMLAYEFDLTKHSGFVHWLGHHRLLGLWSQQDDQQTLLRYRYSYDGGDTRYQANPTAANSIVASSNVSRIFYVGSNDHGVVNYAPGRISQPGYGGPTSFTALTYNWTTGAYDSSSLHADQNVFYAGSSGMGLNQKVITGTSLSWQSYFWDDRIVGTVGFRRDYYKARNTTLTGTTTTNTGLSTDLYVNGFGIDPAWINTHLTNWFRLKGDTKTTGIVFKALRWEGGEFSLRFNKSDNFNPPNGIPVDFYGTPLPKSTGDGKDYGFGLSMFNNKLVARVNWFESNNVNAPATAAVTAIGRVQREDTSSMRSWATFVVRIRHGEDPTSPTFNNNTVTPLTTQERSEIMTLMQVPPITGTTSTPDFNNWPPGGVSGTQTNASKGTELELTYNLSPNWTIKATATKTHSEYSDVAPQIDAWVGTATTPGTRMNVWTTAVANDMPALITLSDGTPVSLRSFWTGYGFNADAKLSNASTSIPNWTSPQGFWNDAVVSEINTAKALQGKTVPNEREWSFSVLTNYIFQTGGLKGFGVGGAYRWASEAIAGFYGDPNNRDSSGNINSPDLTRPIKTPSEGHLDLWVSYTRKIFSDKVRMKVQFNVRDATEGGKLLPVAYNFDGSAFEYRIVDPRQYFLTTSFDF